MNVTAHATSAASAASIARGVAQSVGVAVEHNHDPDTNRRIVRILGVALGVCIVALIILIGALLEHADYAPLGDYPVQRVESKLPGYNTPAVKLSSGEVVVTGTKCAEEQTKIEGRTTWTEVVPGGAVFPMPRGTAVRSAGCTTQTFHNPLPAEVVERVKFSAAKGRTETVWQLSGVETPIAPEGGKGVRAAWQSQNFTIVYDL